MRYGNMSREHEMMAEGYRVTERLRFSLVSFLAWGIGLWILGSVIGIVLLIGYYLLVPPVEKPTIRLGISVWAFGVAFATMLPHEALHALLVKRHGKTCRFGIGRIGPLPVGIACFTHDSFTRNQWLSTTLAPWVVLSVLLLPLLFFWEYGLQVFAMHWACCAGDLWGAWHVLRRPHSVFIGDEAEQDRQKVDIVIWEKET